MKCEEREELLNGMLDGQLSADVRQSLETHLLDCPGCRSRLEALEAQHRDLEAAFAPESRFAAGLADRAAARFEKAPTSFGWRRAALVALAAAAGFLLALLFRPAPPPQPPPPAVAVDTRQKPAWEALEAAHAYGHQHPSDQEGFLSRCASVAKSWPDTDAARAASQAAAAFVAHRCMAPKEDPALALATLRQEISTALAGARTREEVDRDLARLDEELNGPMSREEFARARGLLEAARARRPEPRWTGEVDRRRGLLDARVDAQMLSCASAAKADPGAAKVHRDRVAKWGLGDALTGFDRDVGPIVEPAPPLPPAPEKGLLALAVIGDILVKGPAPKKGERVAPPLFIATRDGAFCAFQTEGGDVLRVNADTRVEFGPRGGCRLDEGEVFVVAKGPVEIDCGGTKVKARDAAFEVSRRDLGRQVKGPGKIELRVIVLRGEAKVDGRAVAAGDLCKAVNGVFEPTGPAEDPVLTTQWTHALLKERPEDAAELMARCAGLAMIVDDPRTGKAAEQALRALGPDGAAGVLPLLRQGKMAVAHRRRLAVLVADLAGPNLVPRMVALLRDYDAAVRSETARGLERVTGQTQGLARTVWSGSGYERGAQGWETWLEKNSDVWGPPVLTK